MTLNVTMRRQSDGEYQEISLVYPFDLVCCEIEFLVPETGPLHLLIWRSTFP